MDDTTAHSVEKRVHKRRWGCFLFGCGTIFLLLLLLLIGLIFLGASDSDFWNNDGIPEEVLEGGKKQEKVAVIDISGIMVNGNSSLYSGTAGTETILKQLDKAEKDSLVKAVILRLNTPGGEVTAADEIHARIRKLRKTKPVVALMTGMAASGGYYAAVACDKIIASKLTMTGSIGVIIESWNFAEFLDWFGIRNEVYKSGKMKDMLNPARERTSEEKTLVQELVREAYDEFVRLVAEGRKIPESEIRGTPLGDGRVYSGAFALRHKLIDELGRLPEAVACAEKLAKRPKGSLKVVLYRNNDPFWKLLFDSDPESRAVRVDVPGLSAVRRPVLRRGGLYFLVPDLVR